MAKVRAGERDKRIAFETPTKARGGLGTVATTGWGAKGTSRWAKVLYGSSSERREAAVEGAKQAATFRVLRDSLTAAITVQDRIRFDGLVWDIEGVAPISGPPHEIEFSATADRG